MSNFKWKHFQGDQGLKREICLIERQLGIYSAV